MDTPRDDAPELPATCTWLNARPLRLADLRGRPVVLAFVNAASAWCMQRAAELAGWCQRHPGAVQAIVVQVPRFDFEREPVQSLALLRRQGIPLPAVLDRDWQAWRGFGIDAWPTLLLLGADGRERGRLVGDGEPLDRALDALVAGAPPILDEELASLGGLDAEARRPLRFPAGLAVASDRLYVADSGHHRVLECTLGGRVLRTFGTGVAGFNDGMPEESAFNRPQGLALARGELYVADTGNHALRRVHLGSGQVSTLVGNGRPGEPREGVVEDPAQVPLHHPAGLALAGNVLLVAMAGDNRIWGYDLGRHALGWRAGSGALESRDGSGHLAAFAQPWALAAVQHALYVGDALSSSVRTMQLAGDLVQTTLGQRSNWEFGHDDGPRNQASLQFPQALALSPSAPLLWIADAGNGSLRVLRLGGGELSTVALPRPLHGPTGLAAGEDAVWISETDAHMLLRYEPASGLLSEVTIEA